MVKDGSHVRIINLYALNNTAKQKCFFPDLCQYFVPNTLLVGDFNSVTSSLDRISYCLDTTSHMLRDILTANGFHEPPGSHLNTFSYHHPSAVSRQSRIDKIFCNFNSSEFRGLQVQLLSLITIL